MCIRDRSSPPLSTQPSLVLRNYKPYLQLTKWLPFIDCFKAVARNIKLRLTEGNEQTFNVCFRSNFLNANSSKSAEFQFKERKKYNMILWILIYLINFHFWARILLFSNYNTKHGLNRYAKVNLLYY